MRKSLLCLMLLASPALAGTPDLLAHHRYAEAEKALLAQLRVTRQSAAQARIYRSLVEAALGERETARARRYLEQEIGAAERAHLPADAYRARLFAVRLDDPKEAAVAMRALEGQPRPTSADLLFDFYRTRAGVAATPAMRQKDFEAALEVAATPERKAEVHLDMAFADLRDKNLAAARRDLAAASSSLRFYEGKEATLRSRLIRAQLELCRLEGSYEQGEAIVQTMLSSARARHSVADQVEAWDQLARLLDAQHRTAEAFRCHTRALALLQTDRAGEIHELLAANRVDLGLKELDVLANHWQRLLGQPLEPSERALVELNFARTESFRKRDAEALALYRQAETDFARVKDQDGVRLARLGQAWALESLGRDEEALALYRLCLGHRFEHDTALGVVRELGRLGRSNEAQAQLRAWLPEQKTADERLEVLDIQVWLAQDALDLPEYRRDLTALLDELPHGSADKQRQLLSILVYRTVALPPEPAVAERIETGLRQQIQTALPSEQGWLYTALADFLTGQRRFAEALEARRRAVEVTRESGEDPTARIDSMLSSLNPSTDGDEIEKLVEECRARRGSYSSEEVSALLRLYRARKQDAQAMALTGSWLAEARAHHPEKVREALELSALSARVAGHPDEALKYTLDLSRLPGLHPDQLEHYRESLVTLRLKTGDVAGALPEARALLTAALAQRDLYRIARYGIYLSQAEERAGHLPESLQALLQATDRVKQLLAELPPDDRTRLNDSFIVKNLFELAANAYLRQNQPKQALNLLAEARSAGMVEDWKRMNVRSRDPQVQAVMAELDQMARGWAVPHAPEPPAAERQRYLSKLNELRSLDPNLADQMTVRGTELGALQKALRPDQRVLQYFITPAGLYVFVIGPDHLDYKVVSVSSARLQQLIAKLRDGFKSPTSSEADLAATNDALYQFLIAPVESSLACKQLYVCPSGCLWYLPFGALKDSGRKYLDERFGIAYLATGDLLKLMDGTLQQSRPGVPMALGSPVNADLAGTTREIDDLRRSYPNTVLLANRDELWRRVSEASILHIASHAEAHPSDPNGSCVQLTGGNLSLSQVYGLSLPRGALVVLSACQTGVGETDPGAEPTSLATAFSVAGAGSVISSLWRVDDEATAYLFAELYRQLRRGEPRAEALRIASQTCRKKYPQPFYWAAFTLLGSAT